MHEIQKQILELNLPQSEDGLAWQNRLIDFCNEKLTPRIESIFDKYDTGILHIIDRIEIHLDGLNDKDFESQLLSQVENKLDNKLSDSLAFQEKETFFQNFDKQNSKLSIISDYDIIIEFLEKGSISWQISIEKLKEFEETYLENWIQKNHYQLSDFQRTSLKKVLKNPNARKRLVEQFSLDFAKKIFFEIHQIDFWIFQKIESDFIEIIGGNSIDSPKVSQKELFLNWFVISESNPNFYSQQNLIKSFIKAFNINELNLKQLEKSIKYKLFQKEILDFFEQNKITSKNTTEESDLSRNLIKSIENAPIFIENAGLILLSPFITEYLKACEVANEKEILDPSGAVHLLQFLVSNRAKTPEYELVLNKILCGIPIETAINSGFEINENHKKQAAQLLNAVLKYWNVMKGTSLEGLRESFLKRKGKLSKNDEKWQLLVEQAPYDMLLEELPWTINIIKTNWMSSPIFVQWL